MNLLSEARLVGPAGFLHDLLRGSAGSAVPLPLSREAAPEGSERVAWMAEALKRDALHWVCGYHGGGWRRLQVVVGGRRREGRLWDKAILPKLGLRFSDAPLQLAVLAMESRWSPPEIPASFQAEVRERFASADPPTGDLLALHRLGELLRRRARGPEDPACQACGTSLAQRAGKGDERPPPLKECPGCGASAAKAPRKPPSSREARLAELLALSPLSQLLHPEEAGALDEARYGKQVDRFAPLFRGDRAALLSYLAPALRRAWIGEERLRRRAPVHVAQRGYQRASQTLAAYVDAARQRPDALRPLIGFYSEFVLEAFGGRAPVIEALREQSKGYDRTSERDAFLRDAAGLFSFGPRIQRAVDDALATPFVDRSEEEKVLLADYHERFREVAGEVEAIRRELRGEIG